MGCYSITPIVIDTLGDGFDLTNVAAGVRFDMTATGRPLQVAWIQADEAWLALDRDGNGTIDNGAELFGDATRLGNGQLARNGFEALAEFDVNGDGMITAADPVYAQLRLWQDVNHNGFSEINELIPLAQQNVAGIEVAYQESRRRDRYGNEFRYRARIYESPFSPRHNRFAYDVILTHEPVQ